MTTNHQQPTCYRQAEDTSRTFKKTWRVLGLYFTISNCRVKTKWPRPRGCNAATAINGQRLTNIMANAHKKKHRLYNAQQGRCWLCREETDIRSLQIHHILPLRLYPELGSAEQNLMLLCPECHRHIHRNALLSANLIRQRAAAMGITDLQDRFGHWLRQKTEHYESSTTT